MNCLSWNALVVEPGPLLSSATIQVEPVAGMLKKNEPLATVGDWVTYTPVAFEKTSKMTQLK